MQSEQVKMQNENIDDLLNQFTKMERETALSDNGINDYDSGISKISPPQSFSLREFFTKRNLLNIGILLLGFIVWSFVAVALLNSKSSRTEEDVFSWKLYMFNVFMVFISLIILFILIQWIRRKYFST